jgi:hypothetical protein
MKVKIIKTSSEWKEKGKAKWQVLNVMYKTEAGKTEGRNVISFVNEAVFNALRNAGNGEVFEIDEGPNAKGYPEIKSAVKSEGGNFSADASPTPDTPKTYPSRDFETAAERAKRQELIVRQSSISNALEYFKDDPDAGTANVLETAQIFYDWVMQKPDPVQALLDIQNDLPE